MEVEQIEEQQPQDNDKGRLYWFVRNVTNKLWNFIKKHWFISSILFLILAYLLVTSRASYQPAFVFVRRYFLLVLLFLFVTWIFYRMVRKGKWVKKIVALLIYAGLGLCFCFFRTWYL